MIKSFSPWNQTFTLKSLINEQGGYVVFLVLSEYSFIRDFRVFSVSKNFHVLNSSGMSSRALGGKIVKFLECLPHC